MSKWFTKISGRNADFAFRSLARCIPFSVSCLKCSKFERMIVMISNLKPYFHITKYRFIDEIHPSWLYDKCGLARMSPIPIPHNWDGPHILRGSGHVISYSLPLIMSSGVMIFGIPSSQVFFCKYNAVDRYQRIPPVLPCRIHGALQGLGLRYRGSDS